MARNKEYQVAAYPSWERKFVFHEQHFTVANVTNSDRRQGKTAEKTGSGGRARFEEILRRCYWKRGEGALTWDIRNGKEEGEANAVYKSQPILHDNTLGQPYI